MALNIQTFKTRTLTAAVFVVVMLTGLLWNLWSFLILFTIIHFGCWYEFVKLMKKINAKKYLLFSQLGLIYISLPILAMIYLGITWEIYTVNNTNLFIYSNIIPCGIVFSIWINDTMAYLVGSMIGKTRVSEISPKKTWEGTFGGIIFCIAVIGLLGYFIREANNISVKHWIIIAAICSVFGNAGDLLESKIKRMANVKDSGSIMPGHGGFLDRFDSLLIATPFVWLYIYFFL